MDVCFFPHHFHIVNLYQFTLNDFSTFIEINVFFPPLIIYIYRSKNNQHTALGKMKINHVLYFISFLNFCILKIIFLISGFFFLYIWWNRLWSSFLLKYFSGFSHNVIHCLSQNELQRTLPFLLWKSICKWDYKFLKGCKKSPYTPLCEEPHLW